MNNFKEIFLKDLIIMKNNGYMEKFNTFYRRLPITSCNCCAKCCYDPPVVSYPEFLYAFDYIEKNFNKAEKEQMYKDAIYFYIMGLVNIEDKRCIFLSEDNRCKIHSVAPLCCKRWGLGDEKDYIESCEYDHEYNLKFKSAFKEKGVEISDDIINFKIDYCSKVKIIKNPYKINTNIIDEFMLNSVNKIMPKLSTVKIISYGLDISQILAYLARGNEIIEERFEILKKYQKDNDMKIVLDYINSVDLSHI